MKHTTDTDISLKEVDLDRFAMMDIALKIKRAFLDYDANKSNVLKAREVIWELGKLKLVIKAMESEIFDIHFDDSVLIEMSNQELKT